MATPVHEELLRLTARLCRQVDKLNFADPVAVVYNPLKYARRSSEVYIERFAKHAPEGLLLGMNPGPFGMAQTGVPFGEVSLVRDWMGIHETVKAPKVVHPKRPIDGFDCTRSEVSGARLWGWAKERYGQPQAFFKDFFVWNYCPLSFMEESGRNRTPDKLPTAERDELFRICDRALVDVVRCLEPKRLIGIGGFAEARARKAAGGILESMVDIGRVLHPSPASPLANRGWAERAEADFKQLGIRLPARAGARRKSAKGSRQS